MSSVVHILDIQGKPNNKVLRKTDIKAFYQGFDDDNNNNDNNTAHRKLYFGTHIIYEYKYKYIGTGVGHL
jgi:hypothetical protein